MDELETAIITKTGHGFEVTDNFGDILGKFQELGSGRRHVPEAGFL